MSRQANLNLYENAVPLAEAWEVFATSERRAALQNAKGFLETFANSAQPVESGEIIKSLFSNFSDGIAAKGKRDLLISKMRESLLDCIYHSELIAMGKRQRPSKSHYPIKIDSEFFDFIEPNWSNSTLENHGKLYTDVRIFDPNAPIAINVAKPPKGSVEAIDRAISNLKLEIPNFCNLPRKSASQFVREKLGNPTISGNGLSDKNLAKRILIQCGTRRISN